MVMCRLVNFPAVGSRQLPQPFRQWLGETTDQMPNIKSKNKLMHLQDVSWDYGDPFPKSWWLMGGAAVCRTSRPLHGSLDVSLTLFWVPYSGRLIDIIFDATILHTTIQDGVAGNYVIQDMRRTFRLPIVVVVVVEIGCTSAPDRHLGLRNFRFLAIAQFPMPRKWKWHLPRWCPKAEVPPSSTTTTMGCQKSSLYY